MDPTWSGGEVGECGEAGLASRDCAGGGWGGWLILDLLLVSKASLNLKMIIFREGLSLSNLCIAISMLGRRKGHRHFQSSQVC